MNKIQALHAFWSGFTWPAYDETSVPDGAQFPYITYEVRSDEFGRPVASSASLYDRTSTWKNVTEKEMEIAEAIGRGGKMIPFEDGAFWIEKANPWAQRVGEPSDEKVRRIMLNVTIEYLN